MFPITYDNEITLMEFNNMYKFTPSKWIQKMLFYYEVA